MVAQEAAIERDGNTDNFCADSHEVVEEKKKNQSNCQLIIFS